MQNVTVVDHPLVQHKLTLMRDVKRSTKGFRQLLNEIGMLLCYEVTRDLALDMIDIETPLQPMKAPVLAGKKLVFAPILRAGVGFLDGMLSLVPSARVAHIGLYRDPNTLVAVEYYFKAPEDVADRLVLQMGRLEREELRIVVLNTKNVVLRVATVYQGNVSTSLVRIAELFRDAIRLNAAGIIVVHNHPSGDPSPSPDDLHLTAEALAAGRLLDIDLLDHLIVGHDAWVSLRDRGVVFDRPGRPRPLTG